MVNSFISWKSISESVATGKETLIDSSGKRHKVKYVIQDSSNFILKVKNDLNLINNGVITSAGINALKNFFNNEEAFTIKIGQLTSVFFKNKFIIYDIIKDTQSANRVIQKIQFSIQTRKDGSGNEIHPNIPANTEFIDANSFNAISTLSPEIISNLQKKGSSTNIDDPTENETGGDTPELKKERGKKFLYTMRTNSKLYIMEFNDEGDLSANTKDGSDPNGLISFKSAEDKIWWSTTLDETVSTSGSMVAKVHNYPLFYDMSITNEQDRSFFIKLFTDEEYRNTILDEYDSKFATSEVSTTNLKNMLYFKNGTPIFNAAPLLGTTKPSGLSKEEEEAFKNSLINAKTEISKMGTTK